MKMKKMFGIFGALLFGMLLLAFAAPTVKKYKYTGFFACQHADIVNIDVDLFKSLMKVPLCAKDSANNILKVRSFEILYAERGLYQDDEGLPIIYTDYSSDRFQGDTLTKYWKDKFTQRLYKGDTVFIENIHCMALDKNYYEAKPIKIILK